MKKTVLKTFALMACGVLSLSCIAGCGGDSTDNGTPPLTVRK